MTLQASVLLYSGVGLITCGMLVLVLNRLAAIRGNASAFVEGARLIGAVAASIAILFLAMLLVPVLVILVLHALRFSGFLIGPLLCATVLVGISGYVLRKRYRTRAARTTILLLFMPTLFAVAQLQYWCDVTRAADRLGADCVGFEALPSAIAISLGIAQFDFHAVALKGSDLYAWSFRNREFFRVRKYIGRSPWNPAWFAKRFPTCPYRPSNFARP